MNYPFPDNLLFAKLKIKYKSLIKLPQTPLQNMFRSAFGNALAEIGGPINLPRSAYSTLFSPKTSVPTEFLFFNIPKQTSCPPPLFLTLKNITDYEIELEMIVIGPANMFFKKIINALKQLGKNGVFKKRIPLRLIEISDKITNKILFIKNQLIEEKLPSYMFLNKNNEEEKKVNIKITIQTPFRIKVNDHWTSKITFDLFWIRLLKRISILSACYALGMKNNENSKHSIEASQKVKILQTNLKTVKQKIYSGHQKKIIEFIGTTGNITYAKVPVQALDLIKIGELIHVGNQITYGFGKYSLEIES
jgi:hypothetical protein